MGTWTVLFENYLLPSTAFLTQATLPCSLTGSKASWVSLHLTPLSGSHSSSSLPCVIATASSPYPDLYFCCLPIFPYRAEVYLKRYLFSHDFLTSNLWLITSVE